MSEAMGFMYAGVRAVRALLVKSDSLNQPARDNNEFSISECLSRNAVSFSSAYDETLSVVAMRVSNPDCNPVGIQG